MAVMCTAGTSMSTNQPSAFAKRLKTCIPVFIVEDHNDVLYYLYRAIGSKKLPFNDGLMIHFDSHPDLVIPKKFDPDKIYDKDYVLSSVSIESWIIPALFAKHFTSVAWIKPSWSTQLSDGIHKFIVGQHEKTKEIKVTCPEPYFVSELSWSPVQELQNTTEIDLQVCTLFHMESSSSADDPSSPDHLSKIEPKSPQKLLSADFQEKLQGCPYVLDIDLDFFSTRNPFLTLLTEEQFQLLRELYHYEHPKPATEEELRKATERRQEQLAELERALAGHEGAESRTPERSMLRSPLVERLLATFPSDKPPDPSLLVDAGCTCDDCDLPHHVSTRDQVRHLVSVTENFLRTLPNPAVITVARSSRDDYCPPEDVDFIQEQVLNMLERLYNSLDIQRHYEVEESSHDTAGTSSEVPKSAKDSISIKEIEVAPVSESSVLENI